MTPFDIHILQFAVKHGAEASDCKEGYLGEILHHIETLTTELVSLQGECAAQATVIQGAPWYKDIDILQKEKTELTKEITASKQLSNIYKHSFLSAQKSNEDYILLMKEAKAAIELLMDCGCETTVTVNEPAIEPDYVCSWHILIHKLEEAIGIEEEDDNV